MSAKAQPHLIWGSGGRRTVKSLLQMLGFYTRFIHTVRLVRRVKEMGNHLQDFFERSLFKDSVTLSSILARFSEADVMTSKLEAVGPLL